MPNYPPMTLATDKINEPLKLFKKKVTALHNTAQPLFSYANAARNLPPPANVTAEMFVPSRLLIEVIVETIRDPAPQKPSVCIV